MVCRGCALGNAGKTGEALSGGVGPRPSEPWSGEKVIPGVEIEIQYSRAVLRHRTQ